jgi:hypothetical protein
MVIEYWPEIDDKTEKTKLVCKMIWKNFEEPHPYKNDRGENRKSDNDNLRVCFNFKPTGSHYFEQCNFFMRSWVNQSLAKDIKLWDGVKHWMQSEADIPQLPPTPTKKDEEFLFKENMEPVDPKNWCS